MYNIKNIMLEKLCQRSCNDRFVQKNYVQNLYFENVMTNLSSKVTCQKLFSIKL